MMTLKLSRSTLGAAIVSVLAACALGPLQPDLAARAPALNGFGDLQLPPVSASPEVQRQFTQGVLQAYAFNEVEAIRMFKAALAQDPACAMCAWGVAWQLGPNINNHGRAQAGEALRYLDYALQHATVLTARDRALIDALALRYGHASQARETAPLTAEVCGSKGGGESGEDYEPPHPLDVAYAAKLRQMQQAAPDDAEILALYAEAEMIATTVDWWNDKTGVAGGRMGEVTTLLERGLQRHPQHTGLNHYLVHAADSATSAQRAVEAADRLGALAPASPHLLHMPSHIYIRVGRYGDAAQVNEQALAADLTLFDVQKAQGFTVSKDWRNHDQHFLWFAALMQGRGDASLQAARGVAERAAKDEEGSYTEYRRSLVLMALLRLERWDAVLAEPLPSGGMGLAQALGQQARGVAYARQQRLAEARAALAKAEAGAAAVAKAHAKPGGFDRTLREMAQAATARLRAEIALAEGRTEDALKAQALALTASQRADESEPPMLAAGARLVLGDMQLRAGRAVEAEQTFRADLLAQPGSGWAFAGLAKALRAQGKQADAQALQPQLAMAWRDADAALLAR
jgi:hypothetical protein